MKMKFLLLCVFISGLSQASDGIVQFNGEIVKSPCNIATNSFGYTVKCDKVNETRSLNDGNYKDITNEGLSTITVEKLNDHDSIVSISYK